jgi:predicted alpha/beta hydrolase
VSFSDDWYAPRKNVEWLLAQYANAAKEHAHLEPYQVGAQAVGHFGFFARRQGPALWPRVLHFVEAALGRDAQKTHVAA